MKRINAKEFMEKDRHSHMLASQLYAINWRRVDAGTLELVAIQLRSKGWIPPANGGAK